MLLAARATLPESGPQPREQRTRPFQIPKGLRHRKLDNVRRAIFQSLRMNQNRLSAASLRRGLPFSHNNCPEQL
jgi:hypothetical protein